MINRITVHIENLNLRLEGGSIPSDIFYSIKRNGRVKVKSVTENILSEDLSQNRYKILSEKEGWANQDKIRELFTFVDQNLELICDKEQEFSYGDDGSEITVRFYQGVHRKGEAIGWCWEFPLGQILRREIDEVLSLF